MIKKIDANEMFCYKGDVFNNNYTQNSVVSLSLVRKYLYLFHKETLISEWIQQLINYAMIYYKTKHSASYSINEKYKNNKYQL